MRTKHLFLDWLDEFGGLFIGARYCFAGQGETALQSVRIASEDNLLVALGKLVKETVSGDFEGREAVREESELQIRQRLLDEYDRRMEEDASLMEELTNPLWLETQLAEAMALQKHGGAGDHPERIVLVLPRPLAGLTGLVADGQISMWRTTDPEDCREREVWNDLLSFFRARGIRFHVVEHLSGDPNQPELAKAVRLLRDGLLPAIS